MAGSCHFILSFAFESFAPLPSGKTPERVNAEMTDLFPHSEISSKMCDSVQILILGRESVVRAYAAAHVLSDFIRESRLSFF
jgi:hypothetical protein